MTNIDQLHFTASSKELLGLCNLFFRLQRNRFTQQVHTPVGGTLVGCGRTVKDDVRSLTVSIYVLPESNILVLIINAWSIWSLTDNCIFGAHGSSWPIRNQPAGICLAVPAIHPWKGQKLKQRWLVGGWRSVSCCCCWWFRRCNRVFHAVHAVLVPM